MESQEPALGSARQPRPGVLARARSLEVSARRFQQLAAVTVFSLWVVVTSGAVVRLTASGLGCDNWPRCGNRPYPEKGGHAAIEFGNRLVALVGILLAITTWLAARRVRRLPPFVRTIALVTALGTVAQIPLGGITVLLDLHPIAVMSHFLLALVVLAGAIVVALEAWAHARGLAPPAGPPWLARVAAVGVAVCAALVVTGAVATASGPHSGGQDIRRLGLGITDTVYVHVRATAVYGIGLLIVGIFLWRLRHAYPGIARAALALLAVLLTQMSIGEIQYRNALPWWLVVIHVSIAATVWALTVAIAYALRRPPAPLAAPSGHARSSD
jgi:heme a synthase